MSLLEAPDTKTISRALVFHAICASLGGAYSVLLPHDPLYNFGDQLSHIGMSSTSNQQ